MLNFASIDFETANQHRTSICSLGIVIVENGVIAQKIYRLVRPRPDFYSYWTTKIHGLTSEDTFDAPDFPAVWEEVKHELKELPLVAHNSPFDEGCLKAVHELYRMEYPGYNFYCTYRTARKAFPHLPNHQLHTVAAQVGFDLTAHHHALADAEACAWIAREIIEEPLL